MTEHELKTDRDVFDRSWRGEKDWEIRRDDRGFAEGQILRLRETVWTGAQMARGAPLAYTGRELRSEILYILKGPAHGLAEGWCVLSVRERERIGE